MLIGVACFLVAAQHRLAPRLVALAIGSFSTFVGALMLMDVNDHLGAALALAVALSVVAFALRERLIPLLVLGVIGSLIATQVLLQSTFTGPIAATIVALLGLCIVAVSIVISQRGSTTQ
jgi:hypothetical protein